MKHFTPTQANKTLPLVQKIVQDILKTGRRLGEIHESMGEEAARENPEFETLADHLDELFVELEEIGCSYRDWNFEVGLVDFPAIIDGKDALLCWRSDEKEIRFYHDLKTGYVGRQPIPEKLLK